MKTIDVQCEIRRDGFNITFNAETNRYETIVNVNGDVRIFNIRSIQFIDDIAIIDGQSLCVDEISVGIMVGIKE